MEFLLFLTLFYFPDASFSLYYFPDASFSLYYLSSDS